MKMTSASSQPLFQKVKDLILTMIHDGDLQPADRVPSESELVKNHKVSRMTANRALRELTTEGHLVGVAGVGRFVADYKARGQLLEIRNIASEVRERKHRYRSEVLLLRKELATEEIAELMLKRAGDAVFHSLILHWEEELPIQLEDRYVNPKIAPAYLEEDFLAKTPHEYLMGVAPLQEAEHLVRATVPDKETKIMLQMSEHEPCLVLMRKTWTAGMLASFTRLHHPGTRYVLGGKFTPQAPIKRWP